MNHTKIDHKKNRTDNHRKTIPYSEAHTYRAFI